MSQLPYMERRHFAAQHGHGIAHAELACGAIAMPLPSADDAQARRSELEKLATQFQTSFTDVRAHRLHAHWHSMPAVH